MYQKDKNDLDRIIIQQPKNERPRNNASERKKKLFNDVGVNGYLGKRGFCLLRE